MVGRVILPGCICICAFWWECLMMMFTELVGWDILSGCSLQGYTGPGPENYLLDYYGLKFICEFHKQILSRQPSNFNSQYLQQILSRQIFSRQILKLWARAPGEVQLHALLWDPMSPVWKAPSQVFSH